MCIFCKIVNGEIPSKTIYEDEHVMAFLDINPRSVGHTLLIPKNHYETFEDIPDSEYEYIMKGIKKVLDILKPLNYDGYNILCNNKEVAGQEVPHVHFHIIPRYKDEKTIPIKFSDVVSSDLEEVYNIILKNK